MDWNIKPGKYDLVYWMFALVMLMWTIGAIWLGAPLFIKVVLTVFLVITTFGVAIMIYAGVVEYKEEQDAKAIEDYNQLVRREEGLENWLEEWMNEDK